MLSVDQIVGLVEICNTNLVSKLKHQNYSSVNFVLKGSAVKLKIIPNMQRPDRDKPIHTTHPLGMEGLVILAHSISAECELCPTMELHVKEADYV